MRQGKSNLAPDFIGIGAMKAATTWIFGCLKEHPEICMSSKKELHFFDSPFNYKKGLDYYYSFFQHCHSHKIKGEITPNYIYEEKVPSRIHKHFPNVKIIACLRNPIERAYSHYRFGIQRKGRLSIYKSFEEALKKDPELLKRGYYYTQLSRYLKFFPRQNILVLIYKDLRENPVEFIQRVYDFIGVEKNFIPNSVTQRKNVTGQTVTKYKIPYLNPIVYRFSRLIKLSENKILKDKFIPLLGRSGLKKLVKNIAEANKKTLLVNEHVTQMPPLKPETRGCLRALYQKDIENLERFIGKDLSFWQ